MEDLIFYGIVIVSIIVSIVKNFQEQKKKDSGRVIGKPATPSATEVQPASATPQRQIQNKPERTTNNSQSVIESAIDRINREGGNYTSLESSVGNTGLSDEERKAFQMSEEIGAESKTEDQFQLHSIFETKDDLKKAILYTAILERKY